MVNLKGKKLMIIGGAFQHCKVVEAAKALGVITYVTDYLPLEKAPAKQIADYYYMNNITDIDGIARICKDEGIDGVISTSLDACQKPYYEICKKLNLPCYGTKEQFDILTDKALFKKYCAKYGVDTIPEYSESDFENEEICNSKVSFPILVKPGESRGSRGQSICNTYSEATKAIDFAREQSQNGKVVIEKYMGQKNDFSMTMLVINKKVYLTRTVDRYLGKHEDGLDKLAVGSLMPSIFTDIYKNKAHKAIINFINGINLNNAPIFMQGFVDGDTVRFYDPGLRLPGGEYERMFEMVFHKNPIFPLIEFALTGNICDDSVMLTDEDVYLKGKAIGQVLPALKSGKIANIIGMDEIKKHPDVVAVFERYSVGETIKESHNVEQRFCEIDIISDDVEKLRLVVEWINNTLKIIDDKGNDMIVSKNDPQKIRGIL